MAGIEFDDRNNLDTNKQAFLRRRELSSSDSKMISFLINKGIVKNERRAIYFLIGLIILLIIASVVILQFDNFKKIDPRSDVPKMNYGQNK